MKIFIEGSALFANNKSGVGQYTKRLTEALLDIVEEVDTVTVYGFMPLRKTTRQQMYAIKDKRLKYKIIPIPAIIYNFFLKILHIHLPIDLLMLQKPDVILYPNYFVHPTITNVKKAVVIHDLGFKYFPETLSSKNLHYLNKYLPYSIKKCQKIITISESTKQQIIKNFQVNSENISLVTPSIDHRVYHPGNQKEIISVKQKYGLPEKYILFVGTLEPRKNIVGLLKAYEALPEKIRDDYSLVLVGGKGWQDDEIELHLKRLDDLPIIRPGYIKDKDLPAVYCGASLFLWPSLYEGFGMPILEAMSCGVPVITANNSSLPEVADDAAVLVDAKDTESITKNVVRVLINKKLSAKLIGKGFKQANKYSWEKSANNLYKIFKEITD